MGADGFGDGFGRMAEHRPRIAQTKIVDLVTVDVSDQRAMGFGHQGQMRHGPVFHPMHRHAVKIDLIGMGHGTGRFGAGRGKAPRLALGQGVQFARVNAGDKAGAGHGMSCQCKGLYAG